METYSQKNSVKSIARKACSISEFYSFFSTMINTETLGQRIKNNSTEDRSSGRSLQLEYLILV